MAELIIVICILLAVLAVFILARTIYRSFKGRCCEGCKTCNLKSQCKSADKDKE